MLGGVSTSENVLERKFDIAGVEGRCLDEGEVVFACDSIVSMPRNPAIVRESGRLTRKGLGLLCGYGSEVPQIALVAHQHNDNVVVGMIPQLLQPACHILICLVLADVVDEQGADGATVVGGRDGAVPFLARRVPNLCLDSLGIYLDRSCCELDADGGLGVEVELVAGESAKQVGLSDARVTDQHH